MKAEYFDEKVGWTKTLLIGFQHVLTMCPGTIAVPLILAGALGLGEKETAFLVAANFFYKWNCHSDSGDRNRKTGRIQISHYFGFFFCTSKPYDPDRKRIWDADTLWRSDRIRCDNFYPVFFYGSDFKTFPSGCSGNICNVDRNYTGADCTAGSGRRRRQRKLWVC